MNRTPVYEQVRDRLIRYAKVDTQSARTSDTVPTTKKQFDLAYMLRDELTAMGRGVPQAAVLCDRLRKAGHSLPDGLLDEHSAADAIEALIKNSNHL